MRLVHQHPHLPQPRLHPPARRHPALQSPLVDHPTPVDRRTALRGQDAAQSGDAEPVELGRPVGAGNAAFGNTCVNQGGARADGSTVAGSGAASGNVAGLPLSLPRNNCGNSGIVCTALFRGNP
ncbi:chaplin family protein [Streptomyces sp. NPDC003952]